LYDTATVYVTVKACPLFTTTRPTDAQPVQVFPNPNAGTFNIYIPSATGGDAHVVVSDPMGKKVSGFTIAANKYTAIQLDAPPGLYFLAAITTSGEQSITKVIVTAK
jgi:hypothetical protein